MRSEVSRGRRRFSWYSSRWTFRSPRATSIFAWSYMYNPMNVMMILPINTCPYLLSRRRGEEGEIPTNLNERRSLSEPDNTEDNDENTLHESSNTIGDGRRNTQQRKGNDILTKMHRPIKRQQKGQRRRCCRRCRIRQIPPNHPRPLIPQPHGKHQQKGHPTRVKQDIQFIEFFAFDRSFKHALDGRVTIGIMPVEGLCCVRFLEMKTFDKDVLRDKDDC